MVELLREGEMTAGQLIERLGLEQANGSQHLGVLRSRQVVVSRREGNQVIYGLRDPAIGEVLEILRQYFLKQLKETRVMLEEIEEDRARGGAA